MIKRNPFGPSQTTAQWNREWLVSLPRPVSQEYEEDMTAVTRQEVRDFLNSAKGGKKLVYYVGRDLLLDARLRDPLLDVNARTLWNAYEAGRVNLTQKRLPDGNTAYVATIRRK